MLIRLLFLASLLALLTGCPPQSLPAPISLREQTRRLTEWSASLPNIKARTVIAGVRLDYRDDNGQDRSVNVEGLLQIHQPSAAWPAPPADVLLLGSSFDQPAFEAGRNAKDWWFAFRRDTKKAWLGDATVPPNLAAVAEKDSSTILRADLVPDLLGLTPLPPATLLSNKQTQFTWQRVDDEKGVNDMLVISTLGTVLREIVVDRRSGRIAEVRMYNPDGILAVRSKLADYVPVTFAEGVEKPATVPQFPRKVTVNYPSQHLTVALEFDTIQIVKDFKPAVFATPDFAGQGLRVIPGE